jgi:hypothetical protein
MPENLRLEHPRRRSRLRVVTVLGNTRWNQERAV